MSGADPTEAAERFVEKWSASELSERAASHEHFIDLCRLIGQPAPAEPRRTMPSQTRVFCGPNRVVILVTQ